MEIGNIIEQSGWRQGSFIQSCDIDKILGSSEGSYCRDNIALLVASQSCDLVHHCIEAEPYVEVSIAREVRSENGNLTYGKNPRRLHMSAEALVPGERKSYELIAHEKVKVSRRLLAELKPDQNIRLESTVEAVYVAWLAARYLRVALPSSFNDLIVGKASKKLKAAIQKANDLSGIYVSLEPDRELREAEKYSVNLLGLYPESFSGKQADVEIVIKNISDVLESVGMTVKHAVQSETKVSVSVIRRFKQLDYDDVSFKANTEIPVKI